jgi:putative ABC transport system permease protein
MNTLVVSFRNVFRNGRRSLMTVLAISVGAISVLLFGGFVSAILFGLQTNIVQKSGHLHVYRQGYMDFGAGSPADYGIPGYRAVMAAISADPELAGRVRVITPRLTLFGIAGNFAENTSKTFLGMGMVPSDRDRMATWDDYGLMRDAARKSVASGLSDGDVEGGQIGIGLARILRLCGALKIADCPEAPRRETGIASAEAEDFATLAAQENTGADGATRDGRPGVRPMSYGLPSTRPKARACAKSTRSMSACISASPSGWSMAKASRRSRRSCCNWITPRIWRRSANG